MTATELLSRMPAKEYDDWREYYDLEPFGQERDNWHMAQLAMLYSKAHGNKAAKFSDFMYKSAEEIQMKKYQETAATLDALKALAKPKTDTT